jgi:MULE transposase-like protein/FAR1 DNA-binding domain-containing protein
MGSLEGVKCQNLQDIEELYYKHARAIGFGVRKSTVRYRKDKISEKYFVCACEGLTNKTKQPLQITNQKQDKQRMKGKLIPLTRCKCEARIRIKLDFKSGIYFVKQNITLHNHDLTRVEWQHLQRSERQTSMTGKVDSIIAFEEANIRPTQAYAYLANEVGGDEFVGHTKRDHLNFVNRLRMQSIESGDAQNMINVMIEEAEKDSEFYYRVRLDQDGKLVALFWCDRMMREDYRIYGDVMIFDTTYRTNRYNLICAPIVGINNHWNTVMFGCAFLADEKVESFEWVLQKFKKVMSEKSPISIFTDQDAAIAKAIEKVIFICLVSSIICFLRIKRLHPKIKRPNPKIKSPISGYYTVSFKA